MTRKHLVRALASLAVLGALAAAPASTGAAPSGPGRIVFWDFMTGQVYTVAPDGSALQQVTHADANHAAINPKWSPDGASIIYTLVRINAPDDHARIWIVRPDGSQAHQLSRDRPGFRNYSGTFTPDGRSIVFDRCLPNDGVCAIWRMAADGTGMRAITPFHTGRQEAVDFDPDVSRTGAVAFTRFGFRGIAAQVWVIPHPGARGRPLTPAWLEAGAADWAPDGRTLVVGSNAVRPGSKLYRIAPDGSHLRRLTNTTWPHSDFAATHSPDGRRIAFITDRPFPDLCCAVLAEARADGSHLHLVATGGLKGVLRPDWSPRAAAASASARVASVAEGVRRSIRLPALCHALGGAGRPYC
jgi:WD40 repeat protein